MILKHFQRLSKSKINSLNFLNCKFSTIYEGLILREKIKYSSKDNQSYQILYNDCQKEIEKNKNPQFVDRMLASTLFSRIIGRNLQLSIYISQTVFINEDVPLDQQVEGKVEVIKNLGRDKYLLKTDLIGKDSNNQNKIYISGQAKIMLKA